MDDGNRRAPISLTAHTPVAQTPGGLFFAQAHGRQLFGDLIHRVFEPQAVKRPRVHAHTDFGGIPLLPSFGIERQGSGIGGCGHVKANHLTNGQVVFQGKFKVALVMRRHSHHGAVAIRHQHIVAHPHFDLRTGQGVRDKQACGHALLFLGGEFGFGGAPGFAGFKERGQSGVGNRGMQSEWVFGRHRAEGHAHEGVGTRGEHVHFAQLTFR